MSLYLTAVEPHPTSNLKLRAKFNEALDDGSVFAGTPSLSTGLLGYWALDGISSDRTGTYNGVDTAVSYVSGKVGQAASLNGSTSYINLGNIPLDSSNWSMAIWIKLASTSGTYRFFSYHGNGPTFWVSGGGMQLVHGGTIDFNPNITLTAGVWAHIVITRSGNTVTAYKDGVQTAQNTSFFTTFSADSQVRIGSSSAFGEFTPGDADEAGIWNRGLSPSEVSALFAYTGGTNPITNPANYVIPGLTVSSANIGSLSNEIDITCSAAPVKGTVYELTVSNLKDGATHTVITSPGNSTKFGYFFINTISVPKPPTASIPVFGSQSYPGAPPLHIGGGDAAAPGPAEDPLTFSASLVAGKVKVQFSEDVLDTSILRTVSNYVITSPAGAPPVTVTGVEAFSDYVLLSLSVPETADGENYSVAVALNTARASESGVGNAADLATFVGSGSPPTVTDVRSRALPNGSGAIRVTFSKQVVMTPSSPYSAANVANYNITGGLTINSITVLNDRTVDLITGPQSGITYVLTISGVRDVHGSEVP